MRLGDYAVGKQYLEKAIAIAIEIGQRESEGTHCGNLGVLFHSLGDFVRAQKYLENH